MIFFTSKQFLIKFISSVKFNLKYVLDIEKGGGL